jgi:hypothetical protein
MARALAALLLLALLAAGVAPRAEATGRRARRAGAAKHGAVTDSDDSSATARLPGWFSTPAVAWGNPPTQAQKRQAADAELGWLRKQLMAQLAWRGAGGAGQRGLVVEKPRP